MREAAGLDPLLCSSSKLKSAIASRELVDVLPEDKWRIRYLWTLLGKVQEAKGLAMEDVQKELQVLIDSLVI